MWLNLWDWTSYDKIEEDYYLWHEIHLLSLWWSPLVLHFLINVTWSEDFLLLYVHPAAAGMWESLVWTANQLLIMLTTREHWYAAVTQGSSKHTLYSLFLFTSFQTFLQHQPSLSQLQNFPELWLGILDFMDKFLHLDNSDLLMSKAPFSECRNNFLLGVFVTSHYTTLSLHGVFSYLVLSLSQFKVCIQFPWSVNVISLSISPHIHLYGFIYCCFTMQLLTRESSSSISSRKSRLSWLHTPSLPHTPSQPSPLTSSHPHTLTHTQYEAIPESLKNMLLVMSTQGIFDVTINSNQSDSSIALSKVSWK